MRAAAALLLMRPSSGTAAIEVSAVLSPMPLIVFKQPLGVAQLVTLTHELHHGVMSFAVSLAQGLQMSRDLRRGRSGCERLTSRQVSAWIMCLSWSRRAANSASCSRTASCGSTT